MDLHRHVVNKAVHKWRNLGEALLPYEQHRWPALDIIAANHPHDNFRCCMLVVREWLDIDPDATWNKLIRALKVGGLPHVANHLEQMIRECEIILSTCRHSQVQYVLYKLRGVHQG